MNDLNYCSYTGNLVRDPELKYTTSGLSVLNFSIANNQDYKGKDGNWVKVVNYFDVVVFGDYASNLETKLKKGCFVLVTGISQQNRWQNKDGKQQSKIVLKADKVKIFDLVRKEKTDKPVENELSDPWQGAPDVSESIDSDIPF